MAAKKQDGLFFFTQSLQRINAFTVAGDYVCVIFFY